MSGPGCMPSERKHLAIGTDQRREVHEDAEDDAGRLASSVLLPATSWIHLAG